jgi:hypothetical protein
VFRLVASLSDGCARLGTVVIGGMDVGWDNRSRPLNLMGKGGEAGGRTEYKKWMLSCENILYGVVRS